MNSVTQKVIYGNRVEADFISILGIALTCYIVVGMRFEYYVQGNYYINILILNFTQYKNWEGYSRNVNTEWGMRYACYVSIIQDKIKL